MKIEKFTHNNVWHVTPTLLVTTDGPVYLSIDMVWLKWGFSWVLKDTISKYE